MAKRKRQKHTKELKEEAVKLIPVQGYSVTEAARNLGINATMPGLWKKESEHHGEDNVATGNSVLLQAELNRLRKENKQWELEREILKKAVAFYAREQGQSINL